jgi:hypothetical protein
MIRQAYFIGWWVLGSLWLVGTVVFTLFQLRREFGGRQERRQAVQTVYRLWPSAGPYSDRGWDIVTNMVVQGDLADTVFEGARVVKGLGEGAFRFEISKGKLLVSALRAARLNGREMQVGEAEALANDDMIDANGAVIRVEVRTS